MNPIRRRWVLGTVTLLAVVASIATSPPEWRIEAEIPGPLKIPSDTGRLFAVSASQAYTLDTAWNGSGVASRHVGTEENGDWVYFLAPQTVLRQVVSHHACTSAAERRCETPPDAFVRIVHVRETPSWMLPATPLVTSMTIPAGKNSVSATLEVQDAPFLDVIAQQTAGRRAIIEVWNPMPGSTPGTRRFTVSANRSDMKRDPISVDFEIRARASGTCDGPPCAPAAVPALLSIGEPTPGEF